ncbi:MAG: hypothetical protein AAGG50_09365 [Bacteroidota bacterium]
MRRLFLTLLPALFLAAGCSRTVPVTIERIEVEHGPNMSVTTQSDAVLETSIVPEVEAFAVSATPGDLAAMSDAELQAAAQDFLDRYYNAPPASVATEAPADRTVPAEVVAQARAFLAERDQLTPLQVEQLDAILHRTASDPQKAPR